MEKNTEEVNKVNILQKQAKALREVYYLSKENGLAYNAISYYSYLKKFECLKSELQKYKNESEKSNLFFKNLNISIMKLDKDISDIKKEFDEAKMLNNVMIAGGLPQSALPPYAAGAHNSNSLSEKEEIMLSKLIDDAFPTSSSKKDERSQRKSLPSSQINKIRQSYVMSAQNNCVFSNLGSV